MIAAAPAFIANATDSELEGWAARCRALLTQDITPLQRVSVTRFLDFCLIVQAERRYL